LIYGTCILFLPQPSLMYNIYLQGLDQYIELRIREAMNDNMLQQFQTEGKLTITLPRLDLFKHKDRICRGKGILHVKPDDGRIEMEVDLSAAIPRRYFSVSRSVYGALYSDCDYWHIQGEIEDGWQVLIRRVLPIRQHPTLLFKTNKATIFKQNNRAIKQCTTTVWIPRKYDFHRMRLHQYDKQMSFTVDGSEVEVEDVASKFVKFNIYGALSEVCPSAGLLRWRFEKGAYPG